MVTYVNLRGTSGAGKSTVAHTILRMWPNTVLCTFGKRTERPLAYAVEHPVRPIIVLGPYTTQCGGCDAIPDWKNILPPLLEKCQYLGGLVNPAVLFEGLALSGFYGGFGATLGKLAARGHEVIFATLDTPIELCLERVNQRRAARGVLEPVNPLNTELKHKSVHHTYRTIAEKHGHRCVMVSHKRPVKEVLALMGITVAREPKHATAA